MNGGGGKKFGGGRVPTGTPSLAWSSVVVVVSLLAGASIVHNIYKPDMVRSDLPLSPPPWPRRQPVRRNARLLICLGFFIFDLADASAGGACRWSSQWQPKGEMS
jgi:hypothetical protein